MKFHYKVALFLITMGILSLSILYLFLYYFHQYLVEKRINDMLQFDKAVTQYVSNDLKPAIYHLQEEGKIDKDYFNPALLSSTYVSAHINQNYISLTQKQKDRNNVQLKIVSDNPTNPKNRANRFEASLLQQIRTNHLKSLHTTTKLDGEEYIVYAVPSEPNSAKCMHCHADPSSAPKQMLERYGSSSGFHEKIGTIRGLFLFYAPLSYEKNNFYATYLILVGMTILFLFLIYQAILYFHRTISSKDALIARQSRFVAMGEMIAMIAHQWRQPLTGIGMIADNMKLDIELQMVDEQKWQENLETVSKQVLYLSETIDLFRNFFKPNQQPTLVNIYSFFKETEQIIASSLKKAEVTISYQCDETLQISTFKNDLMQIVMNLLKNSIDAFEQNGISDRGITIACQHKNSGVEITIMDNAGGIPEDIIGKIFDPYFSTKDEKNGTGIGLYMTKMIIEEHMGGAISAKSESLSTTFTLFIKAQEPNSGN